MESTVFFKKYVEPFIGIAVLILLLIMVGFLYEDNQLKKEISKNCGWGEEDYFCYCEKSDAMAFKNKMNDYSPTEIDYVQVAG